MQRDGKLYTSSALKWLMAVFSEMGVAFDENEWTEYPVQFNSIPTQENGWDCGMFVIL
eukprot:gene54545-72887_t